MVAGPLADEMVAATREFPPSSPGDSQAIADVRVVYAKAGEGLNETPPPSSLMDKLGERLAFEHAGGRLYEALLSKHRAYGSFDGGPSGEDILHILTEEYEHADLLARAIEQLGGDPTALTPSANLAATISLGLPQVLTDPRANLLQSLEAIVVAELADNECWSGLAQLARQDGHEELAQTCREAIAHERDHLRKVRTWIAAGHGRPYSESDGPEFTVDADSPAERTADRGTGRARPQTRKSGKGRRGR
jgi:rubrerythrin